MKIFSTQDTKSNSNYKSIIEKYMVGKEIPKVSIAIEYNGKPYREIAFFKKNLVGKQSKKITGIVFVDNNFEVITDKRLQKELFSAFFNLEKLFDENFINTLSRTLLSEVDMKREENEAEFIGEVLKVLNENEIEGADRVRDIILKLPQMKKENNLAIEKFIEKVKQNQKDQISYDEIICKAKPLYLETLMKNFEKIKLIGSGSEYYTNIRKEALKNYKRRLVGSMGSNTSGEAAIIDSTFSHIIKVIDIYSSILGLSNSEYIKYMNDNEKLQIDEMIEKNRVK